MDTTDKVEWVVGVPQCPRELRQDAHLWWLHYLIFKFVCVWVCVCRRLLDRVITINVGLLIHYLNNVCTRFLVKAPPFQYERCAKQWSVRKMFIMYQDRLFRRNTHFKANILSRLSFGSTKLFRRCVLYQILLLSNSWTILWPQEYFSSVSLVILFN